MTASVRNALIAAVAGAAGSLAVALLTGEATPGDVKRNAKRLKQEVEN